MGVGQCITDIGELEFVVEEFITTQTVEDEVCAPPEQWHFISGQVEKKLCRCLPTPEESHPLPRHEDTVSQLNWLLELVPMWDTELREALSSFIEDLVLERRAVCPPALLHQDLNDGNLLCSELPSGDGAWSLDAVIDWESAAVADPLSLTDEEPWRTARQFAHVAKGSALAERYVRGTLPRCELRELVQCYDEAARGMEKAGMLKYEPWATRVELARSAPFNG